jgi:dihydrofolate reductase
MMGQPPPRSKTAIAPASTAAPGRAYFVLTHEPPAGVPDWMTGTFINENIEAAVARATEAAGSKNIGILGAHLAKQCLEHGLLDEIIIHLADAGCTRRTVRTRRQ